MNEEQCEYMARWLQLRGFVVHTWREDDGQFYANDMRRKDSCRYHGDIEIWLFHENERGKCLNGVVGVGRQSIYHEFSDTLFGFDSDKMDYKTAIQKAVEKYVEKHPDKVKDAEPFLKGGSFYDGEEPSCLMPYYIQKKKYANWRQ